MYDDAYMPLSVSLQNEYSREYQYHKIYNIADYLQVMQTTKGKATFIITFKNGLPINKNELNDYFDIDKWAKYFV